MIPNAPTGWFFSSEFNHFQQVNNNVYAYVSPLIFGWKAQLYMRKNVSMCECEVRTEDRSKEGFLKMIVVAEGWLEKYGDQPELIKDDRFCIYNPKGVWMGQDKKEYWI